MIDIVTGILLFAIFSGVFYIVGLCLRAALMVHYGKKANK